MFNSQDAAAYVLDALTGDELVKFEKKLQVSPKLQAEVASFQVVLEGLSSYNTPQEVVNPLVKTNLMNMVNRTPQLSKMSLPEKVEEKRKVSVFKETWTRLTATQNYTKSPRYGFKPIFGALGGVAVIGLFVAGLSVGTGVEAPDAQRVSALTKILSAPDMTRTSSVTTNGGTAVLVYSAKEEKSALIGVGMKTLPANKTYEVWYINSKGDATSAGLFEPNTSGKLTTFILKGNLAGSVSVGVTVEPAQGSSTPSSIPVVELSTS